MRSNDVTANGLADVVGLPRCPLNATRTLRMIENLTCVLIFELNFMEFYGSSPLSTLL